MALVLFMSSYITKKREKSIIKSSAINKKLSSRFVPAREWPTSIPMQQCKAWELVLPRENFISLGTQKIRQENLKNQNVFKQDLLFLDLKYSSVTDISNRLYFATVRAQVLFSTAKIASVFSPPLQNQTASQGETVLEEQGSPERDLSCTHLRETRLHCFLPSCS